MEEKTTSLLEEILNGSTEDLIHIALRVRNGALKIDDHKVVLSAVAGTFAYSRAIQYFARARDFGEKMIELGNKAASYAERYQEAVADHDGSNAGKSLVYAHHFHVNETITWHMFSICVNRQRFLFKRVYEQLGIPLDEFDTDYEKSVQIARNQLENIDEKLADKTSTSDWGTLHSDIEESLRVGYRRNQHGEILFKLHGKDHWVQLNNDGRKILQDTGERRNGELRVVAESILRHEMRIDQDYIDKLEQVWRTPVYQIEPV